MSLVVFFFYADEFQLKLFCPISILHGRNALLGKVYSSWLEKKNIKIFAGLTICIYHSPGWERTKVIPEKHGDWGGLAGRWEQLFFHSKFRNSIADLSL